MLHKLVQGLYVGHRNVFVQMDDVVNDVSRNVLILRGLFLSIPTISGSCVTSGPIEIIGFHIIPRGTYAVVISCIEFIGVPPPLPELVSHGKMSGGVRDLNIEFLKPHKLAVDHFTICSETNLSHHFIEWKKILPLRSHLYLFFTGVRACCVRVCA